MQDWSHCYNYERLRGKERDKRETRQKLIREEEEKRWKRGRRKGTKKRWEIGKKEKRNE